MYYSTGGMGDLVPDLDQPNATSNQNEPWMDFLHHLLDLPDKKLPTTISISYGENEQAVPKTCKSSHSLSPMFATNSFP